MKKRLASIMIVPLLSGVYFDDLYFLLEKKSKSGNSYQADSVFLDCVVRGWSGTDTDLAPM